MFFNQPTPYKIEIAIQEEEKEYLLAIFKEAIRNLDWEIKAETMNSLLAYTPISLTSWDYEIQVLLEENKASISCRSTGDEIYDFGRKRSFVESLIRELEEIRKNRTVAGRDLQSRPWSP